MHKLDRTREMLGCNEPWVPPTQGDPPLKPPCHCTAGSHRTPSTHDVTMTSHTWMSSSLLNTSAMTFFQLRTSDNEIPSNNHEVWSHNHEITQYNHEIPPYNHEVTSLVDEIPPYNRAAMLINHEIEPYNHHPSDLASSLGDSRTHLLTLDCSRESEGICQKKLSYNVINLTVLQRLESFPHGSLLFRENKVVKLGNNKVIQRLSIPESAHAICDVGKSIFNRFFNLLTDVTCKFDSGDSNRTGRFELCLRGGVSRGEGGARGVGSIWRRHTWVLLVLLVGGVVRLPEVTGLNSSSTTSDAVIIDGLSLPKTN